MSRSWVLFVLLMAVTSHAATYYVSPSGSDANAGTSWAAAKLTIQAGINVAASGDTVLVTNGTYSISVTITNKEGITVRSANGASVTTIDGNGAVQCVYVMTNASLDGFAVKRGQAEMKPFGQENGAGVFNNGMVQNCTISENTAMIRGGGVYNNGILQHCIISNNLAHKGGGGVYNNGIVQNCMILGFNRVVTGIGDDGGGVFNGNGAILRNCLIVGNQGGGVVNVSGAVKNCTIAGNELSYGGIYNNNGAVNNCIVHSNWPSDYVGSGATNVCATTNILGAGNIISDPQFVRNGSGYGYYFTVGDYHLLASSPCINAGTNDSWMTNAVDLDGNARILFGTVDIGAYESTNAPAALSAPASVTASDGTYTDRVSVAWSTVSGASLYNVYRATVSQSNDVSLLGQTTGTNANDVSATAGIEYYYWISAQNASSTSALSAPDTGYRASASSGGGTGTAPSVHPIVKINGSEGSVTLASGGTLTVTIGLPDGSASGSYADFWVLANTPYGWYCDVWPGIWQGISAFTTEAQTLYQGTLFDFNDYEVLRLNTTGLAVGTYTFYFAVDTLLNGRIDTLYLAYDGAVVTLQ